MNPLIIALHQIVNCVIEENKKVLKKLKPTNAKVVFEKDDNSVSVLFWFR
jgi:hypothetical protein